MLAIAMYRILNTCYILAKSASQKRLVYKPSFLEIICETVP